MKKCVALILCMLIIFSFSGCSEPARPDYEMLAERMAQTDESYYFEYFDMFFYDGSYHVYFSLCSEDDVMLSMEFDENCNIDSVTVTADKSKMGTAVEKSAYKSFASAVISSFAVLTDKEKKELSENISFENTDSYFSDIYETYSALRYNFIFSSNSQSINLYCRYFEVMEEKSE